VKWETGEKEREGEERKACRKGSLAHQTLERGTNGRSEGDVSSPVS